MVYGNDVPFINSQLNAINMPSMTNEVTDTLEMFKSIYPRKPASLDDLCVELNVDNLMSDSQVIAIER